MRPPRVADFHRACEECGHDVYGAPIAKTRRGYVHTACAERE